MKITGSIMPSGSVNETSKITFYAYIILLHFPLVYGVDSRCFTLHGVSMDLWIASLPSPF